MYKKLKNIINWIKEFVNLNRRLSMFALAILIVIITIFVVASCCKADKFGNSTGNCNNLGLAAQDGKWIYYIEMDNNEAVGICKVKNNGKSSKKIIDGSYIRIKYNR